MLDLMLTGADRTKDLLDQLQMLSKAIPLLHDVKTEIDQIQKKLNSQPQDEDKDEDRKEVIDDDDYNEFLDFLEDLTEDWKLPGPIPHALPDGSNLPKIFQRPGNQKLDTLDLLRLIRWIAKTILSFKTSVSEKIEDALARGKVAYLDNLMTQTYSVLQKFEKITTDKLHEIETDLEFCCTDTKEAIEQCCQNTDTKLDWIKTKLNNLDPQTDANKDLALQSRARAILAEVQAVRGLL